MFKHLLKHYKIEIKLFKISSIISLIIIYFELFHHNAINDFIVYIFMDVLKNIIDQVIHNNQFITAIVGVIAAFLLKHCKW